MIKIELLDKTYDQAEKARDLVMELTKLNGSTHGRAHWVIDDYSLHYPIGVSNRELTVGVWAVMFIADHMECVFTSISSRGVFIHLKKLDYTWGDFINELNHMSCT